MSKSEMCDSLLFLFLFHRISARQDVKLGQTIEARAKTLALIPRSKQRPECRDQSFALWTESRTKDQENNNVTRKKICRWESLGEKWWVMTTATTDHCQQYTQRLIFCMLIFNVIIVFCTAKWGSSVAYGNLVSTGILHNYGALADPARNSNCRFYLRSQFWSQDRSRNFRDILPDQSLG